ncbi:hypothetical protein BPOR_0228g00100 [Botrytis porri]|uniref:Uncharacterized protein n=1 Tax=Botrytis porri TaxID=87229 RepID=A0A4Z1KPI8_9HELO|nr:hypothetical protein BPOR_0228g00100 [Botrytis porri]
MPPNSFCDTNQTARQNKSSETQDFTMSSNSEQPSLKTAMTTSSQTTITRQPVVVVLVAPVVVVKVASSKQKSSNLSAPLNGIPSLVRAIARWHGEESQTQSLPNLFHIRDPEWFQSLSRKPGLISLEMTTRHSQLGFALFNKGLDRYTV